MKDTVRIIEPNGYPFTVDDRDMLFHVPTSSVFEMDKTSQDILSNLPSYKSMSLELLGRKFRLNEESVADVVDELEQLKLVTSKEVVADNPAVRALEQLPLTTLVLNVNTGCNLSCSYCYKEDLDTPANGQKMTLETAIQSIEQMLQESPDQERYNIVFFGGEPLTNLSLIKQVVDYAEQRFGVLGKTIDFSLTTNGTLLNQKVVEYLNKHRIAVAVSIDGPKAVHDKNRITVGGQGTYDVVRQNIRRLLNYYHARPVGARVTLTRGITDIEGIWDHLFNDLGFHEVGFAPVTSGDIESFNLSDAELVEIFDNMKALGRRYIAAAKKGKSIGFSNMHQLLTDIHEGTKKALPCGAGAGMVAIDHSGGVNLCHRFTGSELPLFGNVYDGIDRQGLSEFLQERMDRSNKGCDTCWIRNLCSGGCYHESYARYGDPQHPVYHYCELMRDWVEFGLKAYVEITSSNPSFMDTYITPRRGETHETFKTY